jgi:hypothetical protein
MAILAFLLGRIELGIVGPALDTHFHPVPVGENPCSNPTCISRTEARHVVPLYKVGSRFPLRVACGFCSHSITPRLVGCSTTRHWHDPESSELRKVRADHLVFLADAAEAERLGFVAATRASSAV